MTLPLKSRSLYFAAVVSLSAWAGTGSAFAANCQASPAPGIDWNACTKKMLIISGSQLAGANLNDTDLSGTDLRNSDLAGTNLEKATLVRASLADSTAKGAKFDRIEGYRTNFSGVDAENATFSSAEVQRSNFNKANLTNADFTKAELGRAQFADATITGAKFPLSNLARADFRSAKFDGPIDFSSAFLFMSRIEGVDLSAATGLAQWQVDMACGDAQTKLPSGLTPGSGWPCKSGEELNE